MTEIMVVSTTTEEILHFLPRPIAIVGNGTPKRAYGKLIDAYPTVIRFNNYKIDGFESQVGTKTTLRCTSGWLDVDVQNAIPEISPFLRKAAESKNLGYYEQTAGHAVATPSTDVHDLVRAIPNPSTGLSLLLLLARLNIEVDVFGFNGFKTPNYWQQTSATSHSEKELDVILSLSNIRLFDDSYPYEQLYNFCHSEHAGYDINEGLSLFRKMNLQIRNKKIIEFGAGNGGLSAYLQELGNDVTAVEVSTVAFQRIPVKQKIHGNCLDLPLIDQKFDWFVSADVLEHLTVNDIKIVLSESARIADNALVSISTRPSGLLGPNGENLHLTVKPVEWWKIQFDKYFLSVTVTPTNLADQFVISAAGSRAKQASERTSLAAATVPPKVESSTSNNFFIKPGYRSRTQPEYYADIHDDGTIWQPEVYPLAATLARQYGCHYIIDIGCGRARKLAAQYPEFEIVGLDFGSNLAYCRSQYPFGNWIEVDLENCTGVDIPVEVLRNAVIVNSDVIEHLANPTRLMELIRSYLVNAKVALISTPERDLERGLHDMGPPANTTHIREWNLAELDAMLSSAGLRPAYCGLTLSNDRDRQHKTSLAVIPGLTLNASSVHDLGAFCEKWLAATPELREVAQDRYLHDLAQLEREVGTSNLHIITPPSSVDIAIQHIDAEEYETAFKVLTDALQTEPENAAVVFQLGRLAAICNMTEDAKELFYQATLRKPELTRDVVEFYTHQISKAKIGMG